MLAEAYPDPGELQRVTVHVPDRPGVLAGITQALGAERINIEDFELRHFSPERGGVLTMLVSGGRRGRAGGGAARGAGLRRLDLARPRMRVEPAVSVQGDIAVPSIKGICQRGVLFGAIADGESEIRNFGRAADTESAISVARQLGAEVVSVAPDVVRVSGVGLRGLRAPGGPLDCGNAGTVLRLTAGILAGQDGRSSRSSATSRSLRATRLGSRRR